MSNTNNFSIFALMQKIGKAFMLPIALLPAAGILLGIGGSLSNPNTIEAYPLLANGILQIIFQLMSGAGGIVFANLPLLFAIGICVGVANKEQGAAGLAGAIGFIVMHKVINVLLSINGVLATSNIAAVGQSTVLGIQTLEMGVFGGIIAGLITVYLHNKFISFSLPDFLAFFNGARFVPIITAITFILVGFILSLVWPHIQVFIKTLGNLVNNTGYIGTFFYGLIERSLIPLGLHHIFYMPFWQTEVGGSLLVNGKMIYGAQNIFFAQLADPTLTHFDVGVSRFMAGKFPFMIFGLPGAALAMYHTSKIENRQIVAGLLISAALTAMITGITEPIEFVFLFVAPVLYAIHAVLAGLSFMFMHMLNVTVGQTFSGGLIDLTLFGILQGNAKTNWVLIPLVGIGYFVLYYLLFRFAILKFNLKTPGREEEILTKTSSSNSSFKELAQEIILAYGGLDNMVEIGACMSRLRITVADSTKVDEVKLKSLGASGVLKVGKGIQSIFGTKSDLIKQEILNIKEGN
jgi:PTS system maltose and glucose-specific IIC component